MLGFRGKGLASTQGSSKTRIGRGVYMGGCPTVGSSGGSEARKCHI